ncbi:unnamed protein product [Pleuronectes platessa]|uniref:Uncharacterized protein n=1 Tax=Pleuronectes platessa TaxID=8262 RepID=A0A9N7YDN3_PLEPL|nr:unnamed protein product [Pleuronectes platessa]
MNRDPRVARKGAPTGFGHGRRHSCLGVLFLARVLVPVPVLVLGLDMDQWAPPSSPLTQPPIPHPSATTNTHVTPTVPSPAARVSTGAGQITNAEVFFSETS